VVTSDSSPAALVVSSVAPYPTYGGGHKRTLRLLEAIRRAGATPHLIVTTRPEPSAAEELANRGIRLVPVDAPVPGSAARLRQHLRRLPSPYLPEVAERLGALRASNRAAFVQFEHTQNAYYFEAARGLPVVLSLQNVDSRMIATLARAQRRPIASLRLWNRWSSMRLTERRAARAADAVLCVSKDDAADFAGIGEQLVVVPNGVDDEFFAVPDRVPEGERVFFFGQFDYAPNELGMLRFLREAWPIVAAERPNAGLVLAGRGVPGELTREVRRGERVEALGFIEDLGAELARSRVAVVPIWHGGGTRLKVLESMAAARPIAGTPLGVSGIGFEHGRHGLVAETPADLAAAVVTILRDRELARRLGAEARRFAERYRWSSVTEPAEDLYRGWIEPESRRFRVV
jgi:glycosyltransferase involved in cell wall biosynthesis